MAEGDGAPVGGAGEGEGSEGLGQAGEAAEGQAAGEQSAPRQYVEVDDPTSRYVRVKVAGEDVEVPYEEALRGYSREADYTRKTQELAQQRQEAEFGMRLQQALQADPAATIKLLQERFAAPQQQQQPQKPQFDDPLEERIYEERQERLALQQRLDAREADEVLGRSINGLRQQFGASDEDIREVVKTAYDMKLPIETFPMIYSQIAYQRINKQVNDYRSEQEQKRQTAAAQASQAVGSGSSSTGVTSEMPNDGKMTIREAAEAAMRQHGAL